MTEEQILDAVVIDASRDLSAVVVFLTLSPAQWCVIGGMAVDSHAPPAIYSARLDVATDQEPGQTLHDLAGEGFRVDVDARAQVATATRPGSGHRLRVAIRYGPAFQGMPGRADRRAILGRELPVASLEDVTAALLAARATPGQPERLRVESEMHLFRLAEQHPAQVDDLLPADLRARAEADREHALACVDGWGESFAL